ncbi:MAG: AAA family ATPase, partial [Sphaerospermopsis kisseleviana]
LTPVIDADGKHQFVSSEKENALHIYDLVIVDEGSMVSKANWESLDTQIKPSAKILVLMDQWQLTPVGEKKIHALSLVGNNFQELTKTKRYEEDSFIYKVISASLAAVKNKDEKFNPLALFPNSVPENDYGHGYFVYSKKEGIESFARQVDRMLQT